jgi:uncharacterized protein YndB with AHSA1/START domain
MPQVKRIKFSEFIASPVARVFSTMTAPESYKEWTAAFAEGSHYVGSWERGARIRFLGPDGDGMLAEIAENRPDEFISIKHIGIIANGVEDTESDAARAWAPAYENYTFAKEGDGTRLVVDLDVTEAVEADMQDMWPKALRRLKAICESNV